MNIVFKPMENEMAILPIKNDPNSGVKRALAWIVNNPGLRHNTEVAMIALDVEYHCKENSTCPVWNKVTRDEAIAIAREIYKYRGDTENETLGLFIEEQLGPETT